MANYRVTAPFVNLKLRDATTGKAMVNGLYAGAIVAGDLVDEESLKRHLDRGWVEKVVEAPAAEPVAYTPDPDSGEGDTEPGDPVPATVEKPKQNDDKAAWVDYAVSLGADRGEAEKMTKADLVELTK